MTIVVLFLASTIAMSTYPFDPRQALSAILIALFVIIGVVIVKVYADMHRDATLKPRHQHQAWRVGDRILVQDHWLRSCSSDWTADESIPGYNGLCLLLAAARDLVPQVEQAIGWR